MLSCYRALDLTSEEGFLRDRIIGDLSAVIIRSEPLMNTRLGLLVSFTMILPIPKAASSQHC